MFQISFSGVLGDYCSPAVTMSGLAPNTTYSYQMDLRQVSTGQTNPLFIFDQMTDAFGNATVERRADITSQMFEVKASMDQYSSDWVLVVCQAT